MYSYPFARHYDALTVNVDYPARARYFGGLIESHIKREGKILLDLACGTGSLSWEFAVMGYEVIGVDHSADMLSIATVKANSYTANPPIFLRQDMQAIDLYGTVDACICALDSLNHLPDITALRAVFSRVSLFLAPGGVFLFDVNTRHKHRDILGDNAFVYETDEVFCVWRNSYREKDGRVDITLDFFRQEGKGLYCRESERFSERIFTRRQLLGALKAAGLELLAVYGDDTLRPPDRQTQREVYAAGKPVQK